MYDPKAPTKSFTKVTDRPKKRKKIKFTLVFSMLKF